MVYGGSQKLRMGRGVLTRNHIEDENEFQIGGCWVCGRVFLYFSIHETRGLEKNYLKGSRNKISK